MIQNLSLELTVVASRNFLAEGVSVCLKGVGTHQYTSSHNTLFTRAAVSISLHTMCVVPTLRLLVSKYRNALIYVRFHWNLLISEITSSLRMGNSYFRRICPATLKKNYVGC